MNRRLTVALAATATLGVLAPAASAAPKSQIRITGGTVFKAGKYMKDTVHFNANTTVASGGTVKVVNKGSAAAGPHTVTPITIDDESLHDIFVSNFLFSQNKIH